MPDKRFDGRDETVIDRDLPIIDAHHHLFDRPALRYLLDDYLADAGAGHKIVASAYCETQAFECSEGPQVLRPLGEIEFANGVAAMSASGRYGATRVCAAIVGYADLRHGEAIAPLLDRALEAAPGRFRGVRQVTIEHPSEEPFRYMTHPPPAGIMKSAGFHAAFKQLAVRRLSFDAAVFHHQLPDIAALAAAFPDTPIVLNHMGMAMALGANEQQRAGVFREWSDSLRLLARRPNVVCKVGGLGMPFWGFGFESRTDAIGYAELAAAWAPYVETAIDAFGAERCMMESNFPPDGRSCGFVPLWNALKHIVRSYSNLEKAALFHDTAARVYRMHVPALHAVAGKPDSLRD